MHFRRHAEWPATRSARNHPMTERFPFPLHNNINPRAGIQGLACHRRNQAENSSKTCWLASESGTARGPDFCPRSSTARRTATGQGNWLARLANSISLASSESASGLLPAVTARASATTSSGIAQAQPEIMPSAPACRARPTRSSGPPKSAKEDRVSTPVALQNKASRRSNR